MQSNSESYVEKVCHQSSQYVENEKCKYKLQMQTN